MGYKINVFTGKLDNVGTASETDPIVGAVNGVVKANGAGTISAATAGTDYLASVNVSSPLSGAGTTGSPLAVDLSSKEDAANKSTSVSTDGSSDTKFPSVKAVKDYADGLVAGLLDYRGAYNASGDTFPATGGSGTAGAIMKGDMWVISNAGTLGGTAIQVGDSLIANTDTPGQTAGNWNTLNTNVAYVPEDSANKVTSLSGSSTDVQYPSAKLVYDQLAAKASTTTVAGKENYHGIQAAGAISFNNSSHVLTVASGTNTYWYKGTQYTTSSAITCDLDETTDRDNSSNSLATNKLYYFYFKDATGKLYWSDTAWNFKENVFVATVYWNGSSGAVQKETHCHTRDIDWHMWAHDTIGCRYESGLSLTAPTTSADETLQIETGNIHDEDIDSTTGQITTMRGWYKASANVFTFADYSLPFLGTSGTPNYLRTSDYSLQGVGASNFACYWVYATLDVDRPCYIVPTHATASYNTIALARAETAPSVTSVGLNPEWKLIYRFIYKGDGQFQESNDYRTTSTVGGAATASTTAGAVSFSPTGGIASTSVQSAIEELDSEKAAVGQTMYIGTTQVAINRASNALTLAGLTLTTPDIGTPSAGNLANCTFPTLNQNTTGTAAGLTSQYIDWSSSSGGNSIANKPTVPSKASSADINTGTDDAKYVTADALAGADLGKRVAQIKVFADDTEVATGDGKQYFCIPSELNGFNLVDADAFVTTVSSSGTPTVQIYNLTQTADMLSTRITIDANEYTSYTAATAPAIDANNDDVATGDILRIDVDVAGTGTKGLGVTLSFQLP